MVVMCCRETLAVECFRSVGCQGVWSRQVSVRGLLGKIVSSTLSSLAAFSTLPFLLLLLHLPSVYSVILVLPLAKTKYDSLAGHRCRHQWNLSLITASGRPKTPTMRSGEISHWAGWQTGEIFPRGESDEGGGRRSMMSCMMSQCRICTCLWWSRQLDFDRVSAGVKTRLVHSTPY